MVICPSSLRRNWFTEFSKYCDSINYIKIITSAKDCESVQHYNASDVFIISYDLLSKVQHSLLKLIKFKIVIADESHYIKSMTSQRSQVAVPLLQSAKHAILLSGTPALSRPIELYPQLRAINSPNFLPTLEAYGKRYC